VGVCVFIVSVIYFSLFMCAVVILCCSLIVFIHFIPLPFVCCVFLCHVWRTFVFLSISLCIYLYSDLGEIRVGAFERPVGLQQKPSIYPVDRDTSSGRRDF